MLCCILLALSETLLCRNPFFAFSNEVLPDGPVDGAFVYDRMDRRDKSSRITTNTVAFGAAKISALVERNIAGEGWKIRSYPSVGPVYTLEKDETQIRDIARTGALAYGLIGDENAFAYPSNRHVSCSNLSWRLTAGNLVGTAVGTSSFASALTNVDTYAGGLQISKIWEKYGKEPPELGGEDESGVIDKLSADVVSKTFPCLSAHQDGGLNGGLLFADTYMGSAKVGGSYAEFYEPLLRNFNDYRAAGRIRAYAHPQYEPFLRCRFDEVLSDYCNPSNLMLKTMRPNYGKSSAEAWLVALKDADLITLIPNAEAKQYFVTFNAEFPVTLDPSAAKETSVVFDEDKMCYHVSMKTEAIKIGEPSRINITTNDYTYESIFHDIMDSLNGQMFSHYIYFNFNMIQRIPVGGLLRLLPDNGNNYAIYGELDEHGVYLFRSNVSSVAIPSEGVVNTNWTFICSMGRSGTGSFSSSPNEFRYSTNAFDFGWAITNRYFHDQTLYNVYSVGERLVVTNAYGYSSLSNAFKAYITSTKIAETNSVINYMSEFEKAYNDVLGSLDAFEQKSEEGANLRRGVILPPMSSREIRDEIFGFDIVADRRIYLGSDFMASKGKVYKGGLEVRDYYYFAMPLNYESWGSMEKDNRNYFGTFAPTLKVIYSFDNLCPSWAKRPGEL